jgi:flagellum-specific ATP synthase
LNRTLAESGHYPAIDIEQSISRAMHSITTPEHQQLAGGLKHIFKIRAQQRFDQRWCLCAGLRSAYDEAIRLHPRIIAFFTARYYSEMQHIRELGWTSGSIQG